MQDKKDRIDRKDGLSSLTTQYMDPWHQILEKGKKTQSILKLRDWFGANSAILRNYTISSVSTFLKKAYY